MIVETPPLAFWSSIHALNPGILPAIVLALHPLVPPSGLHPCAFFRFLDGLVPLWNWYSQFLYEIGTHIHKGTNPLELVLTINREGKYALPLYRERLFPVTVTVTVPI